MGMRQIIKQVLVEEVSSKILTMIKHNYVGSYGPLHIVDVRADREIVIFYYRIIGSYSGIVRESMKKMENITKEVESLYDVELVFNEYHDLKEQTKGKEERRIELCRNELLSTKFGINEVKEEYDKDIDDWIFVASLAATMSPVRIEFTETEALVWFPPIDTCEENEELRVDDYDSTSERYGGLKNHIKTILAMYGLDHLDVSLGVEGFEDSVN